MLCRHETLSDAKFCISIVFVFSWDYCKSQEKLETMLMQNVGGQTKSIMVFFEVAYSSFFDHPYAYIHTYIHTLLGFPKKKKKAFQNLLQYKK